MEEAIVRGWVNLLARLDGPMHVRFILQPTVAILLALRAGIRDARAGELPFLVALQRSPGQRRARLRQAWRDIRNVFLVAAALDCIYQIRAHHGVFLLELVVTATLLALVPYGLTRGPARRLARRWLTV
jgi:hypothetical protein